MEIVMERPYKIVRTLPDGERLLIGSFADEGEARKKVTAYIEYWPGDYAIVPLKYEQGSAYESDVGKR